MADEMMTVGQTKEPNFLRSVLLAEDGIMRELRAMRREMRLMKGEQRRTSAKVISVAHNLEALKEHMQHHEG